MTGLIPQSGSLFHVPPSLKTSKAENQHQRPLHIPKPQQNSTLPTSQKISGSPNAHHTITIHQAVRLTCNRRCGQAVKVCIYTTEVHTMLNRQTVGGTDHELAQMRRLNKVLAWLPRFRIPHRLILRGIQGLLKLSQMRNTKLVRHGVRAERKIVSVEEATASVRVLYPKGVPKVVVLDIHGGGWVIGSPNMNDVLNLGFINACDAAVVSIDYRLAPSTSLEGQIQDCLVAARWLLDPCNPTFCGLPVIVVGESAGGHLAAACLLGLKVWPELLRRIQGAVLYYGVYDLTGTPSVRAAGPDTLVLDGPGMVDAMRRLTPGLNDEQRRKPPLSPLYADLNGLPPALLVVGERDPLLDDTLQMAARWGEIAPADLWVVREAPHGFVHFGVGQTVIEGVWRWVLSEQGSGR